MSGASGETGQVGGQLGWNDVDGRPPRRAARGDRLATQDLLVYRLQFRAWVGTEFVVQPGLRIGVALECLGAATGGVQCPHECGGEGLVEVVFLGQVGKEPDG